LFYVKKHSKEKCMWSIVQAAGWPIWFLIIASVIAVALIFERVRALRTAQVVPPTALRQAIGLLDTPAQQQELSQLLSQGSAGAVLAAGVYTAPQGAVAMRTAMEDALHLESSKLNRYLPALGTIAGVAPLLGLFGTVIGMIETFGAQTPSGMNPAQLAHGISVALYNTALGIFVAIVGLLAYRFLRSKVEQFVLTIEAAAGRLLREVQARSGA
jgi:biopolymer transport protein ExbB